MQKLITKLHRCSFPLDSIRTSGNDSIMFAMKSGSRINFSNFEIDL